MDNSLSTLTQEIMELEADTFEITDYADAAEAMNASTCSSTTSSCCGGGGGKSTS
jgi:uncharacterized membrane protein